MVLRSLALQPQSMRRRPLRFGDLCINSNPPWTQSGKANSVSVAAFQIRRNLLSHSIFFVVRIKLDLFQTKTCLEQHLLFKRWCLDLSPWQTNWKDHCFCDCGQADFCFLPLPPELRRFSWNKSFLSSTVFPLIIALMTVFLSRIFCKVIRAVCDRRHPEGSQVTIKFW